MLDCIIFENTRYTTANDTAHANFSVFLALPDGMSVVYAQGLSLSQPVFCWYLGWTISKIVLYIILMDVRVTNPGWALSLGDDTLDDLTVLRSYFQYEKKILKKKEAKYEVENI